MPKRVLCKFFAHGACLKGELCEYSHEWKAPPNNICTYYQKGVCAYGSRCRYEHIKLSQIQSLNLSSSTDLSSGSETLGAGINTAPSTGPFDLPSVHHNMIESDDLKDVRGVHPADRPMCSFAAAGECPRGVNCPYIHGDLCPTCGKNCLHPFRPPEREEHMKSCEKRQKKLEALKLSEEIECGVCLDLILSKPTAAERKFGILSECDHSFCISCIRSWRGSSPRYNDDGSSTLRSCPMCRKLSYFVIPSDIWFSSKAEKQEIIDNYKAKLRSIDCKHFKFGNANCPFGSSCFYKHTIKPGSFLSNEVESSFSISDMQALLEQFNNPRNSIENEELDYDTDEDLDNVLAEVMALLPMMQEEEDDDDAHAYRDGHLEDVVVRHLGAEDENTLIAKNIRLSDFLSNLQIR